MTDSSSQLHAIVRGRVQGVYFRATTQTVAQRLQLKGWVRNLPDGAVEVLAEGPRLALEQLLSFLQHGPAHAVVDHVELDWRTTTGEFQTFEVRP